MGNGRWGGRISKKDKPIHQELLSPGSSGGAPSSTWTPSPPPPISKYYQKKICRSDSPGAGAPSWEYLGAASQELDGACRRRAVIEGSLLPTVMENLRTERSQRGDEGRGEQGARTRAVGEGPDYSLEEWRGYGDVTWREAGEEVG